MFLTLIGQRPKLPNDLVDVGNLHAVITQEGIVQGLVVLAKIVDTFVRGDSFDHNLTMTLVDVFVVLRVELPLEKLDLIFHPVTTSLGPVSFVFEVSNLLIGRVVLGLRIVRSLDELDLFVDLGLLCNEILLLGDLLEHLDVVLQILLVTRLIVELLLQGVDSRGQISQRLLLFGDHLLVFVEVIGKTALSFVLVGLRRYI